MRDDMLVSWLICLVTACATYSCAVTLADICASASDSSGREHDGTLVVIEDDDGSTLAKMSSSLGEGSLLSVSDDSRPFFRPHYSTRLLVFSHVGISVGGA